MKLATKDRQTKNVDASSAMLKKAHPLTAFDRRLQLRVLLFTLPAQLLVWYFCWTMPEWSWHFRFFVGVSVSVLWLLGIAQLTIKLNQQWRVLVNVAESIKLGDYSLRGRGAKDPGAYGELVRELNSLADHLQEQRLQNVEQQFLIETIIHDIDIAIFAFDHQRRLTLANDMALSLLQRTRQDAYHHSAEQLGISTLLDVESTAVIEFQFADHMGQWGVRKEQFREHGLPQTLLFVTDVQQLLRQEEQKVWTRLIRVLSHEVNNALSPIISISESLRRLVFKNAEPMTPPPGDELVDDTNDIAEGLSIIEQRAQNLSIFVRRYAELARLPPPERTPQDLNRILQSLTMANEQIKLIVHTPNKPIPVFADLGQIQQVLNNLLKNAQESTDTAQTIEIRVEPTAHRVSVQIMDEGPGVVSAGNLFVPFYSTKPGGSGIGLLICRQIIEAHGGRLSLRNRNDRSGCVAEFELPLSL